MGTPFFHAIQIYPCVAPRWTTPAEIRINPRLVERTLLEPV